LKRLSIFFLKAATQLVDALRVFKGTCGSLSRNKTVITRTQLQNKTKFSLRYYWRAWL